MIAGAAVVGIVAVGGVQAWGDAHPAKQLTLTEAACKLLGEGESADRTFEVVKDVAGDHRYTFPDAGLAARAAVDRAVAQGC